MHSFTKLFTLSSFLAFFLGSAAAPASAETLFTTQTPVVTNGSHGGSNYEKGMAFYSVASGQITAIRFWKGSKDTGTHVGKIWSSTGDLLASAAFTNETSSGWQQQSLAFPLSIAANTTYVVSVNTTRGHFAYTADGLDSQISNGNLRSVVGDNGRWGDSGEFPANDANGTNYFRDVVFVGRSVSSLSLSPSSVVGGTSSIATVTLTSPAPSGGAVVTLSSNNPAASAPATVTVSSGSASSTFTVATSAVGAATSANISATYNGARSATLTINSPALSALALSPSSLTGGGSSTGTVTLTSPAPAGGAAVTLSSDNPAAVVPASVMVAGGSATGTFTIATSPVASTTSVSISGAYNGSRSASLTIASPTLATITLNPASVTGGAGSTGMAILDGPAPAGGVVVSLSGVSPAVQGIQGVYSPAGLPQDGSIEWGLLGPIYSLVPSAPIPITGMPGSTATITTAAGVPQILTNCASGGNCAWYGNFSAGETVLWTNGVYTSSTPAWKGNGPLTITFNNPQRGLGFQIMADEAGAFTGTLCAYNSSNAPLGCIPFSGNGLGTADGSAAYAGLYDDVAEIARVTVDAGGAMFPHDFAIGEMYAANTRRQMVPATVTVPAGATGATFPIATSSVQNTTAVTIGGVYAATRSATLTINPPVLSTISVNPDSVQGGDVSTGTATLNGPAPVGGAQVTLSGVNPPANGIQTIHSASAAPQDGTIDWTLAPLFSSLPSGFSVPIAGIAGSAATIATASGLPAYLLDNCAGGGNCSWYGNFSDGARLLWVGGKYNGPAWTGNGPLTIAFSSPKHAVGFHIMADESGPFTATVCAYNSTDTLLACSTFNGNGTAGADGSAIYAGLYSDLAEISKITVDAGGARYPHDFAIGKLYVSSTGRQLLPDSVTVPAGAVSASFPVTPNLVNNSTSVTITGTHGESKNTSLEVRP